ncbi:MAG: hypothetical protein MJ099_05325 [Clostridia bacterium]|nr:hypothetical protein [Clostridia bacterium]
MRDYKVTFWNPGCMPADDDVFGCATLGFADGSRWVEPTEKASACWRTLRGEAYGGSYDEMLAARRASEARPVAILVLFTGEAGNDRFVDTLQDV